jgi:hypothetical protein
MLITNPIRLVDLLELNLAIHALALICLETLSKKNVQDEVRVRGDQAGEGLCAVGKVAGDVEARLLAELHGDDALVPAYSLSAVIYPSMFLCMTYP